MWMSQQIVKTVPKYSSLRQRTQQEENLIIPHTDDSNILLLMSPITQAALPITLKGP